MARKSQWIDPRELKRLSVLQPHRTLLAISIDWALIAAAIAFSKYMQHPLAYIAAVMVIAGRMHALAACCTRPPITASFATARRATG